MSEILLIGTENSGKTVLMRSLKELCASGSLAQLNLEGLAATIGVDLVDLHISANNETVNTTAQSSANNTSSRVISIRELGSAISSKWHSYYEGAHAVIFTVDASDIATWSQSILLLHEFLQYFTDSVLDEEQGGDASVNNIEAKIHTEKSSSPRKPLLILFTKTDLTDSLNIHVLRDFLRLEEVLQRSRSNSPSLGRYPRIDTLEGSLFDEGFIQTIKNWMSDATKENRHD